MADRKSTPPVYGIPDADIPEMTAADFRKARPIKKLHLRALRQTPKRKISRLPTP